MYLKSINIQDGDGGGVLVGIHLSIDPLCQPMKEQRVQDLGNCISIAKKKVQDRTC